MYTYLLVESILRSNLCDYSDVYILAGGTITTDGVEADDNAKWANERNKRVIFKNFAQFTECINDINNNQIDNTKDMVLRCQCII